MQAMILAAGAGTRLLPHTLIRPKPLFPVLNQPLLLLTIKRLQRIGFDHILINCHYLRDQVIAAIGDLSGVVVLEEETILGTGGGLRNALKYIRDEPLLVTNGDIYHTVDLAGFYSYHIANNASVTLAMHDHLRFNKVCVSGGKVTSFDDSSDGIPLAFTGIHMINPEILENIEPGSYSCIIDHYRKLLGAGIEISCYRADECFWTDMGTPGDYLDLHQGLLKKDIPCWSEFETVRRPYCIDKKAKLPANIELAGWACIGGAHIENGSHLERVVIWDDVCIPAGSHIVDQIVSGHSKK